MLLKNVFLMMEEPAQTKLATLVFATEDHLDAHTFSPRLEQLALMEDAWKENASRTALDNAAALMESHQRWTDLFAMMDTASPDLA